MARTTLPQSWVRRMPPEMRKWWMHREIEAIKEAGDREIALELESILGWWDLASAWRRAQVG